MSVRTAKMSMERQLFIEFIEKYKEFEFMWKVNHKDYKNKPKRLNAVKELLQILRKSDEHANIDTVTKRINTMRSSFNKEQNKVKASYQSGTDNIHVPKLWYYDLLLFLTYKDNETRPSIENADILEYTTQSSDDPDVNNTGTEDYLKIEPESPSSDNSVASTSASQQNTPDKSRDSKRKWSNSANKLLTKISNRLDSTSKPRQKYSFFGEHVAESLRSMPNDMAIYCQKVINDAIFQAEFGKLNHTSRVVTD